jgi:hypothetical protein
VHTRSHTTWVVPPRHYFPGNSRPIVRPARTFGPRQRAQRTHPCATDGAAFVEVRPLGVHEQLHAALEEAVARRSYARAWAVLAQHLERILALRGAQEVADPMGALRSDAIRQILALGWCVRGGGGEWRAVPQAPCACLVKCEVRLTARREAVPAVLLYR